MTSFEVDTASLDALASAVLRMTEGLTAVSPRPATVTGSAPLDSTLADLAAVLDDALAELGRSLRVHGLNATAAGRWYEQVEHALASGR